MKFEIQQEELQKALDVIANVVPACRSCNASKCNTETTTWMRRKRLDEQAFLLRHRATSAELSQRFVQVD